MELVALKSQESSIFALTNHFKTRGMLPVKILNTGAFRIRVAGKKTVRVSFLVMIGQP